MFWALTSQQAIAQLRVDLSTTQSSWGTATLDQATQGVYGRRNEVEEQGIQAVECSDSGELRNREGKYVVGAGCGDLKWQFSLAPYPTQGEVASRQLSWFSSAHSWWLISEGVAILQPPHVGQPSEIGFLLDGQTLQIRAGSPRLPALHQAPGFWLLGDPAFVDKGTVRHFFDRGAVPQHLLDMLESHEVGISYLLEIFPPADLSPVFWMGLADWQSTVGGAMGTGLVLANYPVVAEDFDNTAFGITLYVVLHEHSHGLMGEIGSLWMNESLASYLAIKAIQETSPEHYPLLADAFIEPGKALDSSLPVIGKRAAAGEYQAYSQLYMGAAFWEEIDFAMIKQGGQVGLLSVLRELLARGFSAGGAPSRKEIAEVTGLEHETLSKILDQYFGT